MRHAWYCIIKKAMYMNVYPLQCYTMVGVKYIGKISKLEIVQFSLTTSSKWNLNGKGQDNESEVKWGESKTDRNWRFWLTFFHKYGNF